MAATGKTPILLYGSTTPTNTPTAGNLTNSSDGCEIAINVADKNLFFKDSTNAVNTVPIRQSSASSDGWLSSTDWNTFNNKQPAGTYVTSVTGTAPVVSSGGTTPAISMAAANGSTNGYLTSTDWTTFNNKQTALVSGTNIKTVNGTTLLGSGDLGTINVNYGGTGLTSVTAGYIPFGNSSTALGTDSNLFWDNTNKFLGIGTASPGQPFVVKKDQTSAMTWSSVINATAGNFFGSGFLAIAGASSYYTTLSVLTVGDAIWNASNGSLQLQTGGSIRAYVTSAGTLFGGTSGGTGQVRSISSGGDTYAYGSLCSVNTSGNYWNILTAGSGASNNLYLGYNTADKGYFSSSTGAYTAVSDRNVKKNIDAISYGLKEILALTPVEYNMVEEEEGQQKHLGFIAQEVKQILPTSVSEMQSGILGMDKSEIIPVLVKAIQEQQQMIEQLQIALQNAGSK